MTTIQNLSSTHFNGGANLNEGNRTGDDDTLAECLQAARVDMVAVEARATSIEAVIAGLDAKASVRLCTAGALGAYVAAGAKVGKTLTQVAAAVEDIDGQHVVVGDRILVNNDGTVTAADRGIYTVTVVGTVAVKQVLTRATDADENDEFTSGMFVRVEEGTLIGTSWYLATANPIDLDVDALSFASFDRYAAVGAIANVTKAAAAAGVANTIARGDHKHDITTAAPGATGVATAAAEGTATSLARSDHAHISNTAPADVTKAAAVIGASGEPARADHKHDISTAAAVSVAGANAEGAATSLARSNHTHKMELVESFAARDGTTASGVTAVAAVRNLHNVVAFDDTLEENFDFEGVMPRHLDPTGNLMVRILFAMASDGNVAHTLVWSASFERIEEGALDIDGDSFAAEQSAAAVACPATIGYVTHADITFTRAQADGVLANEGYRLKIHRNVAAGGGSTGDAHVIGVQIWQ